MQNQSAKYHNWYAVIVQNIKSSSGLKQGFWHDCGLVPLMNLCHCENKIYASMFQHHHGATMDEIIIRLGVTHVTTTKETDSESKLIFMWKLNNLLCNKISKKHSPLLALAANVWQRLGFRLEAHPRREFGAVTGLAHFLLSSAIGHPHCQGVLTGCWLDWNTTIT